MQVTQNKFKLKSHKAALALIGGIFTLVGITTLTGVVLSNTSGAEYAGLTKGFASLTANNASAITFSDDESVSASVKVVDSCTITKIKESTTGAVTIASGTYDDNVKQTTFRIICNDPNGYDVYAIGYSNDTDGTTDMINIDDSASTIPTGLTTDGYVSSWSMKLAAESGTYAPIILGDSNGPFTNFHVIPSASTKVVSYNGTVASDVGSDFTATYASYISYSQAAGTYEGKVKYSVSHPNVDFASYYMQDFTTTMCNNLTTERTITLYDRRDEKAYTVAKLKDGKCWMTQNLRITGTISSADSNFSGSDWNICVNDLTAGDSYEQARCHDSGNTTNGVWYNFCAVSAGATGGCSSEVVYAADTDICPSGWHLPSWDEFAQIVGYVSVFSPVGSGCFSGGSNVNVGNGNWWSASSAAGATQVDLYYSAPNLIGNHSWKNLGYSVRCVRN